MQGMEPLTELPKDVENPAATPTAEEIEAKRIADEAAATAAEAEKKKNQDKPLTHADPELSDDQLIKLLAKKGITAASLEELKKPAAPPDPEKEAELREANELAYGLQKGLFNKKDYAAAERFWSPNYIQHSAHIPPGREGLFALVRGTSEAFRYENGLIVADGDYVLLHGRFSGLGLPANWIVADIVRLENGQLAEHWDVIQDEATKEASVSGLPMFGDKFPA